MTTANACGHSDARIIWGNRDVRLLRVISVDSVRRKNARGENSDQYGYKLNHGYWSSNAQPHY